MEITLVIVIAILVRFYFKWKLTAHVLAAWIAENNYTPPDDDDCNRLKEWVVHKWLHMKGVG